MAAAAPNPADSAVAGATEAPPAPGPASAPPQLPAKPHSGTRTERLAVVSLVSGLSAWIFLFLGFVGLLMSISRSESPVMYLGFLAVPCVPLAVIAGHMARRRIRRSGGALTGKGLALTGMILIYLPLSIAFIFFAIGVYESELSPSARRAKLESPINTQLWHIGEALKGYQAQNPTEGYPQDLQKLLERSRWEGTLEDGRQWVQIETELLRTSKYHVYSVAYTAIDADKDGIREAFTVVATPIDPSRGLSTFCLEQESYARALSPEETCGRTN